jgi:hypoxanthine phosphoribosyltransferase
MNERIMPRISLHNKEFDIFIGHQVIIESVDKVAAAINRDYAGKCPIFLSILNGSFMFTSDLLQRIEVKCMVSFLKLASYQGLASSGKTKQLIGLNEAIEGKDIVIIEDIVDSGHTMLKILEQVKALNPASVRIATFLFKPEACKVEVPLDYVGIEVPNAFIVGYGLDYDGLGRNYPDIYSVVK